MKDKSITTRRFYELKINEETTWEDMIILVYHSFDICKLESPNSDISLHYTINIGEDGIYNVCIKIAIIDDKRALYILGKVFDYHDTITYVIKPFTSDLCSKRNTIYGHLSTNTTVIN